LGFIGYRHAALLAHSPGVQLVAACDVDPHKAAGLPAGVAFHLELDTLLQDAQPNVLHICTPNHLHLSQALTALAAGCHVVIEKPMGLSHGECLRVVEEARKVRREVFVVMQNRYTPAAQWLKTLIQEGRLGRVLYTQVNCFWNRDERYYTPGSWRGQRHTDGGALYTQFSHFVDTLYWLLGPFTDIQARMTRQRGRVEIEDTGVVQFGLPGGGQGTFQFSTAVWDQNLESSITLLGERGSVRVGGQYMNRVEACHIENYTAPQLPEANPPNQYGPYQGSAANHSYVIKNVIATLRGQARPYTPGEEGAEVVRLIEEMYRSAGLQPG
jgi:predicted dehydrogenase